MRSNVPLYNPYPPNVFPFYEEGKRKVSRDGHIAVQQAFYSVPPEYLGCEVWVRWNSRTLRILNERMQQIAIHCTQEKGRFSTLSDHIVPEKIHGIERGVEFLLRKVRFIGVSAARWSELLIEERGVQAVRSMQGLLIIDDMGMKQLPKRSGEYLFEIIMRRHELRSTMMTSNRPLEEWGKLIGDVPAATAILDRFLHHAEVIQITGRSYRLEKGQKSPKGTKAPTGSDAEES